MSPWNTGSIVSVRGSVIDVRFEHNLLPVCSILHGETENEVMAQLDARRMRGIILTQREVWLAECSKAVVTTG